MRVTLLHQVLGVADMVLPTADSVSMVSEAFGVGKPVAFLCSNRCRGKVRIHTHTHTHAHTHTDDILLMRNPHWNLSDCWR